MIKIIDNTGLNKKKNFPKVPFFTRDAGNGCLHLIYGRELEDERYVFSSINLETGYAYMQDFNTLEEMFESPAYTLDKIVHVEITVGDIYE